MARRSGIDPEGRGMPYWAYGSSNRGSGGGGDRPPGSHIVLLALIAIVLLCFVLFALLSKGAHF